MANLEKIIKVTQEQYDILASGGKVGDYVGLQDNYIYMIEDTNEYITAGEATNLGYYDTISENSDGTYTITRQTGYVYIGNETLTYFSDNDRPRWLICNLSGKAVIPSVNTELGQIITANYETKTEANAWNTNSGMSLNTSGDVVIYGATRPTPTGIIQYKLATPYTEKVEKNHYAAYNQNFILEHNKSEAERSANLFNPNNVEYGSINEDGSNLENGHARARSFYIPVLANTYYSISTNNSELLVYELYQYDSNKSNIAPYIGSILNNTFTFLTRNNTCYIRILFKNTTNTDFNLDILSRVMLNEGSVALPYQPYEGKVVHEKDLGDTLNDKLGGYLPLSGGVLTGNLCFKEISNGTFPVTSSGIVWNGSTDNAAIFYRLDAADAGRLVFRTGDDTNCNFVWNNTASGNGDVMTLTGNGNLTVKGDITSKGNKVALDKDVVKLTGDQSISGTKTFSGKIINTYLKQGIIDTHPENNGTIISYYTNDLGYLFERGGSCVAKNITQNKTITVPADVFDCSPSY